MKKILTVAFALFMAVMPAFAASAVYVKPFTMRLSAKDGKTVELAILKACKACKWSAVKVSDTEIQAHLAVRAHRVSVSIRFDENGYEINYLSSENMSYNSRRNSIHSKYNTWVAKLNKTITSNITSLAIEELENAD